MNMGNAVTMNMIFHIFKLSTCVAKNICVFTQACPIHDLIRSNTRNLVDRQRKRSKLFHNKR